MSVQDIAALKKQRGLIKASCTRIKTYVESIDQPSPSVIAQLEERRVKLDKFWADYNVVQTSLELANDAEADDRISFEEGFYAIAARIRVLTVAAIPGREPTTVTLTQRDASGPSVSPSHVRLPKLNIPSFSGKYEEWFPFRDIFKSIIHSNPTLTNAQKLQYLKTSVVGEASNVICSLEITDANYNAAWERLKERYDNERVVVQNHIRAIMDLPSSTKEGFVELRQIADGAAKHLHALQALKRPCDKWDDILIVMLASKLDPRTSREWQSSLTGSELPTLRQFFSFLSHHCQALEASATPVSNVSKGTNKAPQAGSKRQVSCPATIKAKCNFCKGEHSIYYCKNFLALSVPQRKAEILSRQICVNCLKSASHNANKCPSGNCKVCQAKHNTLLHSTPAASAESAQNSSEIEKAEPANPTRVASTHTSCFPGNSEVLLSTAVMFAFDHQGKPRPCRVLLDGGSQANFISKQFLEALGLKSQPTNITISGVNGSATTATKTVQIRLQSRISPYTAIAGCVVSDRVTENLPAASFDRNHVKVPRNIVLADPHFNESSGIDILIGAELFWEMICVGQIRASASHPLLQKTRLGWIFAGRLNSSAALSNVRACHVAVTNRQLHEQVNQLWQLDNDFPATSAYSLEERLCEQQFNDNVSRNPQGRYVVKLPIKEHIFSKLGDSRDIAMKRLRALERRFLRKPALGQQYNQFMEEYLALGHMRAVNPLDDEESLALYLPHHCIFKGAGESSKIRVVFDASCKTDSGVSLNDALRVGPVIQQDLASILMRFRYFRYVLSADIIKMYRQILIDPRQSSLQRILWRRSPEDKVETYELLTVTYGTSAASFLATRCLVHLAEQHESEFPSGSRCVKRDFYVDDLLTGADCIRDLELIRDEVIQLLQSGSFELSKWASNCPQIIGSLQGNNSELIALNNDDSAVLGVGWNRSQDTLHFSCELDPICNIVSKRTILSETARCFYPLGLLGPINVVAKLILQELWQSNVQWDESVPQDLHTRWLKFRAQLFKLNQIRIPRGVRSECDLKFIQIHGFCDASQNAYGACVYIRTRLGSGEYHTELLCSKSRVAPLKATSTPRLELSSALLLARLISRVDESLQVPLATKYLWSDSTISLNWIASPSRKWSVFVANRVGEIQRLANIKEWRHVGSSNNPADILSRGSSPQDLSNSAMWWHGPPFLQLDEGHWPDGTFAQLGEDIPEQGRVVAAAAVEIHCSLVNGLLTKYSSLNKACRIMAYCLRFSKARRPTTFQKLITPDEFSHALKIACRDVQIQTFSREREALSRGEPLPNSSKLLPLSPFLGEDGLIRVGGRLKNAQGNFDSCHPILLPGNHDLTRLVIEREHIRNFHAGSQATMAAVRQTFWPLSLRSSTRRVIHKCVVCFKSNPRFSEAVMAPLPASRVTVSRPFSNCGVDYAGPVIIREGRRRNARNHKAYVAIFVCFVTKAVHIELVSDLTADAFLGAFKRFISRRGKPVRMFSDNGTTFVGAYKQLRELYEFCNQSQTQNQVEQFLVGQGISWSFIPPNAPHFGGLWEAAVKSAKLHMARIVGKAHLTFEELQTVLGEIEAILNSRPITALSTDPNDMSHLTPGHFLIGAALNSFPSRDLKDVPENRLLRWQRVEQIRQHFWRRWSTEYLQSLQERSKWRTSKGVQLLPN